MAVRRTGWGRHKDREVGTEGLLNSNRYISARVSVRAGRGTAMTQSASRFPDGGAAPS